MDTAEHGFDVDKMNRVKNPRRRIRSFCLKPFSEFQDFRFQDFSFCPHPSAAASRLPKGGFGLRCQPTRMNAEAFRSWALDPARTLEERFATQLVVEMGVTWWHADRQNYNHESFEVQQERVRQRALNPAYQPQYAEDAVRKTAEQLHKFTWWPVHGGYHDRPVRDLAVLRFLPNLERVDTGGGVDLGVLAELPKLRDLVLGHCEDYRAVARCRQLRTLTIVHWRQYTRGVSMWPDFTGLEQLEQLEMLTLEGNLLAFRAPVTWPRVRIAVLKCQPLEARSLRELPQLPACEFLTLAGVERLDGIEAFPRLRNLKLETDVRDFGPLAALEKLTCFTCSAFKPLDLRPLTRLPQLQCATFDAKFQFAHDPIPPRDFAELGGAPILRELHVTDCPPVALEVAALNATLPPWDDVLLAETPRPLPATLRMITAPPAKVPNRREVQCDPGDDGLPDKGLRECEGRWVGRFVEQHISVRLGAADWGSAGGNGEYRTVTVTIESYADVEKLPQIVAATRECLARLRPDYHAYINIWLKAPKLVPTPAQEKLADQFQEEQDQAEYERSRREQAEYIERLHNYELKKQLGEPINPEEFAPGEQLPLPPPPWEREDEADDEADDDPDAGDVAVKKKPDPPPMWYDDYEHPLADEYRLGAYLTLDEIWFYTHHRDLAIYLMRRQPDLEIPEEKKPE